MGKNIGNSLKKLHVGLIFGGRSGEHEVSLASARSVLANLDPEKYEVTQIGITHEGVWLVGDDALGVLSEGSSVIPQDNSLIPVTLLPEPTRHGIYIIHTQGKKGEIIEHLTDLDVVFPVLHGTFGEDGTLQGLFELGDIAYVGAGVLGSAVGMDKDVFKKVMLAQQIPTVEWVVFERKQIENDMDSVLEQSASLAPFPLFVKPCNLGSSVGITKCRSRADLIEGLLEAASYGRRILVERGLEARDIEVSVLGNDQPEASIPGEIIPDHEFYSYEAKYISGGSQLLIPAPIPAEKAQLARELAVKAYKAIDCAGMARADFLLERDSGEIYLSEVNTIPGFTQISMYPKLWEACGLPYPELIDRLIALALERKAERDRTVYRYR